MIFLKTFNERLGIDNEVLTLADELYNKLKNKSIIETTFNNRKLIVMIDPKCTLKGSFSHLIGINGLYYKIVLSDLDKSTLIHEIKHMFRASRLGINKSKKDFIPTKSEELSNKHINLFKNEDYKEFLIDILYFTDVDEFESFYHEIYFHLKEELPNIEESKRHNYISEYIKNQQVYFWNKALHDNPIDIENIFNNKNDFNFFMNQFEKKIFNKLYHKTKMYDVFSKIKRIFVKDDYSEFGKKLSFLIHKNANKNYRKLMRIYSLFN